MTVLFVAGASGAGCKDLLDTFNAGEIERDRNEENRRRFHQQQAEKRKEKMAPVLKKTKRPSKEPLVVFDPESPEGTLLAELKARQSCRSDTCRSEGLQRIRRHHKRLLPALPKLMTGQEEAIVVEALRLAGLFKVRSAVDAVGRVLLLADKQVKEEAIWTLGAIGDTRGVEPLRRYSTMDNPPRVMAAICRSLGQIGTGVALAPIETVFLQGTPETRVECLDAAARVRGGGARALFERAMKDPRPLVSELAAKYLKTLEPPPPEPVPDEPAAPAAVE